MICLSKVFNSTCFLSVVSAGKEKIKQVCTLNAGISETFQFGRCDAIILKTVGKTEK